MVRESPEDVLLKKRLAEKGIVIKKKRKKSLKRETKKAIRILEEILEKTEDKEKRQLIEKDLQRLKSWHVEKKKPKVEEIYLLRYLEKLLKKYTES